MGFFDKKSKTNVTNETTNNTTSTADYRAGDDGAVLGGNIVLNITDSTVGNAGGSNVHQGVLAGGSLEGAAGGGGGEGGGGTGGQNFGGEGGAISITQTDLGAIKFGSELAQSALDQNASTFNRAVSAVSDAGRQATQRAFDFLTAAEATEAEQLSQQLVRLGIVVAIVIGVGAVAVSVRRKS